VEADRWIARGAIKVIGDVNLGTGRLDGTVSLGGKLTATGLEYRGKLDVGGAVDVPGTFTGSGSLRAGLTLHAGDVDLKGTARVLGATSVDRALSVRGSLVTPSLTVGELDLEGEAHVAGDLVGTSVSARLTTDSAFGAIRARSVTLRAKLPNLVEKVFGRRVTVTVQRVEADSVDLEAVDVKFVHAPQITLGRDAHVTEYEGTIVRRHPSSRVGFESRSRPPYGLSR
jgi:cytoskeletal protein CcmA (bactofilin family)